MNRPTTNISVRFFFFSIISTADDDVRGYLFNFGCPELVRKVLLFMIAFRRKIPFMINNIFLFIDSGTKRFYFLFFRYFAEIVRKIVPAGIAFRRKYLIITVPLQVD